MIFKDYGYCQANSLDVVKVYNIAETASKDQSRKIFSELLTYLKENSIYNLAVEKTDRLTRNLKDAVAKKYIDNLREEAIKGPR